LNFVQNFNRTTLAVAQRKLVILQVNNFIFGNTFLIFFYVFHCLQVKWFIFYI